MAQEAVSIKGTKHGLVIVLDPGHNFEELKIKLQDKIASAKGFFKGARFTLMAQKITEEETIELQEICCEFGLIPCDNIELPQAVGSSLSRAPIANKPQEEAGSIPLEDANCLLLYNSIRSGQVISHDGHITVLGDVNGGGEIIASGNILVMGALRGTAHAGAEGDGEAVIVAYQLEPEQLRIGNIISRSPEQSPKRQHYPERAYLSGKNILIEPYTGTHITGAKRKALI